MDGKNRRIRPSTPFFLTRCVLLSFSIETEITLIDIRRTTSFGTVAYTLSHLHTRVQPITRLYGNCSMLLSRIPRMMYAGRQSLLSLSFSLKTQVKSRD